MTLNLIDLLVSKNACSLIKLLISGLKRVPCDSSCSSGSKIWLLWDFVLFQFLKVVISGRKSSNLYFFVSRFQKYMIAIFTSGLEMNHLSHSMFLVGFVLLGLWLSMGYFSLFSFSRCIVYPPIYSFRLPLWYLPTFLNKTVKLLSSKRHVQFVVRFKKNYWSLWKVDLTSA